MKFLKKPSTALLFIFYCFCVIYVLLLSSNRYTSNAKFIIKSQEIQPADFLGSISGLPSTNTSQEGEILVSYITSLEVLNKINQTINLKKVFSCEKYDRLFCLPQTATQEKMLEYWNDRVSIYADGSSGIISLDTQAFEPKQALAINEILMNYSEEYINNYNEQIMNDGLGLASKELERAEQALADQDELLRRYQSDERSADPIIESQTKLQIIGQLESKLTEKKTELSTLRSYMRETAPAVVAKKQEIAAINQQLNRENARLIDKNIGRNSLPKAEYEKLVLDKELAQKAYSAALAALESARFEAEKQQRYLIRISNSSMPEEHSHPKRFWLLLKIALALFLISAIGKLVLLTVKDHIGWT